MACILGIDIGTTSTIGILIRLPDQVLGSVSRPVTLRSPQPGWSEEDPEQWWSNLGDICRELLQSSGVAASDIAGIGVTGMLPAVVLLDNEDRLVRPSIQQSDGRCGQQVQELREELNEADFIAHTGNGINQQLVSAKLRWLERHEPQNFARIATVFGAYDYINWRLTGIKRVEQNWALEAGFIALARHQLDDELIALAHIPRAAVPELIRSHAILGKISRAAAEATGLAAGTPVIGGAADMIASALGAGVSEAGDVLLKFGGSLDILTTVAQARPDPRLYLDYHLIPGLYMPNGCMSTGGSGLNWFAYNFAGQHQSAAEQLGLSLHQYLDRLASDRPPGAQGLTLLPYFLGEKTPLHDPAARGTLIGLTLSHDAGHLWRALLEGYAFAIRHHIDTLRDIGYCPTRFIVSDGGASSRVWMQIVADVLQQPLQRLQGHPGSCLGAAWCAAIGIGLSNDWQGVTRFVQYGERILPDVQRAEFYHDAYLRFRQLYRQVKPLTDREVP